MNKIIFVGLALLFTACARQTFHSDLTASTRVSSVRDYKILGEVEASACNKMILFFPIGANYKNMYKQVFEQTSELGGNATIDFQVRSKRFLYVYPFGLLDCWEATGTAIKMGSGGSFQEKSSVWDKPLDAKKTETPKPAPSKWDKAPK
jgi:hypothetical protein